MLTNNLLQRNKAATPVTGARQSFFKPVIQPKLSVNQPGDPFEQEADAVADSVMRMSNTDLHQSFFKPASAAVQRKCQHCEEEETLVHRKEDSRSEAEGSSQLDNYVGSLSSSGHSLPDPSRQFFESRFGHDFSGVKLHTDAVAAKSAQSINAVAYTTGNNIVFNSGQYSPESEGGKRLLAHELTHVVQQHEGAKLIQKDEDADKAKAAAEEAKKKVALITKIQGYGITDVEDVGGSSFTSAELTLVDQALSGLPDADKAAIKGAKIRRLSSLGDKTGGMYTNTQSYNGGSSSEEQKIELSDAAFGSLPASESVRIITHEVGHALAAMPQRLAMSNEILAAKRAADANDTANTALDDSNTALDASNAAVKDNNDAVTAYNNALKGKDKDTIAAAKADLDAKKAIMDSLQADTAAKQKDFKDKSKAAGDEKKNLATAKANTQSKSANISDFKSDAATRFQAMQTAYTGVSATIKGNDADSADYRQSLSDTQDAIKTFYNENAVKDVDADTADTAKAIADAAITDRNAKRAALDAANPQNKITSAMAALETAQNNCLQAAATLAYNKNMSLRVRKFYDFVVKNGISPALTPYAAENWPSKPEEFYAEAYSFFITKPADLEAYSKPLSDWFKAGNYK